MKFSSTLALAYATAWTNASVLPRAGGACPAVWTQVSQDLTKLFLQPNGQCTADARAAVRASFHDCGTWSKAQGNTGGCDGSLILSAAENARPENRGLQDISTKLQAIATQRKVGVADMIAFAGAHATVTCPLGPTVKTYVGRKDSSTAAPNESLLPANATLSADTIISLFADKGFSAPDVAALVGAHTSAQQFFADPAKAGEPQDTTPGVWDVKFYSDTTTKPPNVFVFQSDMSLSKDSRSGPTFQSFVGQQARWNEAFADTFSRLNLLGVPQQGLIDCTSALPPPRDNFPVPGSTPTPGKPSGKPSGGGPKPTRKPDGSPASTDVPSGFPSGAPPPPAAVPPPPAAAPPPPPAAIPAPPAVIPPAPPAAAPAPPPAAVPAPPPAAIPAPAAAPVRPRW